MAKVTVTSDDGTMYEMHGDSITLQTGCDIKRRLDTDGEFWRHDPKDEFVTLTMRVTKSRTIVQAGKRTGKKGHA